jgi:hypothetical protein
VEERKALFSFQRVCEQTRRGGPFERPIRRARHLAGEQPCPLCSIAGSEDREACKTSLIVRARRYEEARQVVEVSRMLELEYRRSFHASRRSFRSKDGIGRLLAFGRVWQPNSRSVIPNAGSSALELKLGRLTVGGRPRHEPEFI